MRITKEGLKDFINQDNRKGLVIRAVLATLAVGGLLAMAAVAPNAGQALTLFTGRRRSPYYVQSVIGHLLDRGWIKVKKTTQGKKYLQITERGRQELLKYQLGALSIKKPRRWDGKWRVIIFDIKEFRRGDRDRLRRALIRLGFVRLQNSVWVHPYECEELIFLLKSSLRFGRDLLYLTVERLEDDRWLRQHFGLN